MRVDNGQLKCKVPIGFMRKCGKLGICRGKSGHRTTLSFRTSAHTGVGISIEFRATYRHTDRSFCAVFRNLPVCYRKMMLLFGGLPHHLSGLVRNDREFGFAMTGNSMARQIPICRTAERYRAGQAGNDYRPRSSRPVSGDSPPNSNYPLSIVN